MQPEIKQFYCCLKKTISGGNWGNIICAIKVTKEINVGHDGVILFE
jgi:hypothetical protein